MTDVLMARLATATTEEGKTVTYKWVARELDVSVNHAKRLLFAHSRKNDSVLVATHVVSGWTSVAGGDEGAGVTRTQVIRLVEGADALAAAKAALDEVTGEHVYSVRPVDANEATVGGDAGKSLPPACIAQTDAMFDASPSTPNALRDNRHSAVSCASAKRDDGPARRVTAKPKPSAVAKRPEPPKPAKAEPAAATAGKAEPTAPAPSKPSSKPSGAFAGFKPVDKKAAAPSNPGAPPKSAGRPAAKGAGAMAAMFARAPPKKAAAAPATPAPVPVEEDSEEEEEEEEFMEAPRHRRGGGRRVLGLDEDEDEDEEVEAAATAATAAKAAKAASPAKKPAKSPAKKPAETKAKNKRKSTEHAAVTVDDATAATKKPKTAETETRARASPSPKKETKKPLFSNTPAAARKTEPNPGARVKKVITVMDDETGEEFTKTVWVDRDTGEPIAEGEAEARDAPAPALEEKTNAKKPAGPAKPAGTKRGGGGAPAKSGGIASFFGKK